MIAKSTFTIASGGTASDFQHMGGGYRLVGLLVPTLDSTTITFEIDEDGSATGSLAVKTNTHAAAPAALNLGTADTGAKAVAVPEEVGRLTAVAFVRLITAAQTGGARSIVALWEKD